MGVGGPIKVVHNILSTVVHNVEQLVMPSKGKAVEHRVLGGTTDGRYSDEDFEKDLTFILEPGLKEGYELLELKNE